MQATAANSTDANSHFTNEVREALAALEHNPVAQVLLDALATIEGGQSFQLQHGLDEEISPQQASELLKISRPFLYKLLNTGEIPEQPRVGTHRKIKMRDVQAFLHNRERASRLLANDIAHSQQAQDQLIRDGAGVDEQTAAKFGF